MNDAFFEVLESRRSIRSFHPQDVPEQVIAHLISAATMAPTAGNMQAWYFYLVREEYLRTKLAEAALQQNFIAQAPAVIVVCADLERAKAAYKDRGVSLYCIQDAAAASQNMLLSAHAMGLGACWVGAFDEAAVADLLDLPGHHRPLTIMPIGYPARLPNNPGRRQLVEIYTEID